eukprot:7158506-Alexandrium_andersonii.AAC.1
MQKTDPTFREGRATRRSFGRCACGLAPPGRSSLTGFAAIALCANPSVGLRLASPACGGARAPRLPLASPPAWPDSE